MRDRRAEHTVVRRVVLHLVEPESPPVVRLRRRSVHVRELGVPLEGCRADERARIVQRGIRPPAAERLDGRSERCVQRVLVDVDTPGRLIVDVVRGRTDDTLPSRDDRHARSVSSTNASAYCSVGGQRRLGDDVVHEGELVADRADDVERVQVSEAHGPVDAVEALRHPLPVGQQPLDRLVLVGLERDDVGVAQVGHGRIEVDADRRRRLQRARDVQVVREGLGEVLPRVHRRVLRDEALVPVGGGAELVVTLQRVR